MLSVGTGSIEPWLLFAFQSDSDLENSVRRSVLVSPWPQVAAQGLNPMADAVCVCAVARDTHDARTRPAWARGRLSAGMASFAAAVHDLCSLTPGSRLKLLGRLCAARGGGCDPAARIISIVKLGMRVESTSIAMIS